MKKVRFSVFTALAWLICCAWAGNAYAQGRTDSLLSVLRLAKEDSSKVTLLLRISGSIGKSDSTQKLYYAQEALNLARKLKWERGMMQASNELGRIYGYCCNDAERAIQFFSSYGSIAEQCHDPERQADALSSIAEIHNMSGRYKESLEYYRKSLAIETDSPLRVYVLVSMGTIYFDIGDYANAQQYYTQGLGTMENYLRTSKKKTTGDSAVLDAIFTKIGNNYLANNDYDAALQQFEKARELNQKLQNRQLEVFALKNMGRAYELKKDFGKARQYYTQALEEARKAKELLVQAELLNEIGNIYAVTQDPVNAIANAEEAQHLLTGSGADFREQKTDYYIQLSKTYTTLGKAYGQQKKYAQALENLQQALDNGTKSGSLQLRIDVWKEFYNIYEAMNQPAKALDAFKHYIEVRDSVYNNENTKQVTKWLTKSEDEHEQTEERIRQAEARNKLNLKYQKQRILTYSVLGGLLLLMALSLVIYRGYNKEKRSNRIIQAEKQKSDDLLLNILPKDVADELKTKRRAHAREFDHVTVMFIDFVNFTVAAEKMSPQELVDELDSCFSEFDEIVTRNNIEKIKTVGDAHLSAAGLPKADPDHAANCVKAAMEIKDFMLERRKQMGSNTFEFRIGIHTGSVVAGIVGVKKFAYDIWGDTVNTAARMEQASEPGKINISETTYELVKNKFACTYRGEVQAKNKGLMKMYFVG